MSAVTRIDDYQREHRWAGFSLAVIYKYFDDQGPYLAALITYYAFVSLFPLLLLSVTILGFALNDDPELRERILESALGQFPIIGDQLRDTVNPLSGHATGLMVGILGALYGGLGVAQAGQNAMNKVWGVPRNARPNPIKSRVRSLMLLLVLGTGVLLTTALSAATTGNQELGFQLSGRERALPITGAIIVNFILFLSSFRILTSRHVTIRHVLPGVIVAAVGWQLLQTFGTYYLSHVLKESSQTYGLFGLVLGSIAWIYLGAVLVVFAAEINVVSTERLWPRALLTPFTDNVKLTPGDEKAYTSYAATERYKGYQRIRVDFGHTGHGADPETPGDAEPVFDPDDESGTPWARR
jgi:inner membrane protein YhjD